MSDVIATQDMKPQCVLLRFWHLNQAILTILFWNHQLRAQDTLASASNKKSIRWMFCLRARAMMRPTINEESDCLRKKYLQRRPCTSSLLPTYFHNDDVSIQQHIHICYRFYTCLHFDKVHLQNSRFLLLAQQLKKKINITKCCKSFIYFTLTNLFGSNYYNI